MILRYNKFFETFFAVYEFFKNVERNIFEDIMTNHIGVTRTLSKTEIAIKQPSFPQINTLSKQDDTK